MNVNVNKNILQLYERTQIRQMLKTELSNV